MKEDTPVPPVVSSAPTADSGVQCEIIKASDLSTMPAQHHETVDSMNSLQEEIVSAASDNDNMQEEISMLQQKQDSMAAELEDDVDQEIDHLREQIMTNAPTTDDASHETENTMALPKLAAEDEDTVLKLSGVAAETKQLENGIFAASNAEEQALQQQIETAKSHKHELQRQLSQASEQNAKLRLQMTQATETESRLVGQQKTLIAKQQELLQA